MAGIEGRGSTGSSVAPRSARGPGGSPEVVGAEHAGRSSPGSRVALDRERVDRAQVVVLRVAKRGSIALGNHVVPFAPGIRPRRLDDGARALALDALARPIQLIPLLDPFRPRPLPRAGSCGTSTSTPADRVKAGDVVRRLQTPDGNVVPVTAPAGGEVARKTRRRDIQLRRGPAAESAGSSTEASSSQQPDREAQHSRGAQTERDRRLERLDRQRVAESSHRREVVVKTVERRESGQELVGSPAAGSVAPTCARTPIDGHGAAHARRGRI